VTFCPLCNSALAFNRMLEGRVFDFGVSGNLRNSDLIMWDRQTQTWWQQLTGEGIVGELAGHQLPFIPASIISWADFKAANPDGLVLSRNTGFNRPYGSNPYSGYDRVDQPPSCLRAIWTAGCFPKSGLQPSTSVTFPPPSHSRCWRQSG